MSAYNQEGLDEISRNIEELSKDDVENLKCHMQIFACGDGSHVLSIQQRMNDDVYVVVLTPNQIAELKALLKRVESTEAPSL